MEASRRVHLAFSSVNQRTGKGQIFLLMQEIAREERGMNSKKKTRQRLPKLSKHRNQLNLLAKKNCHLQLQQQLLLHLARKQSS